MEDSKSISFYRNMLTRCALSCVCSLTGVAGMFGILALATASPAAAQVVYDEGAPNQVNARPSDPAANVVSAEIFTFASLTTFDAVDWWGTYGGTPATDAFTILFYGTTGGVPDDAPLAGLDFNVGDAVNRTATGLMIAGSFPEYSYSATLSSAVTLDPGTYAISIVNDPASPAAGNWFWEATDPGASNGHYARLPSGGTWLTQTPSLSFRLRDSSVSAAPEPGSLALLALAGLPIGGAVTRRHRSSTHRRRSA
jgi:hypothetical protein